MGGCAAPDSTGRPRPPSCSPRSAWFSRAAPRRLPGQAAAIAAAKPAAAPLTTDEVSAATGTALQEFWRQTFPAVSGRPWTDITQFVPVRTDDPAAPAPPCVARAADVAGKAFYCPAADAVVWDASGLVPKLRDRFGPAAVVVVLAHEVGHAVQTRLDINAVQDADPGRYPTILLETMADCYAGVALRHLVNGGSAGLPVSRAERDDALLALIGFRDPLGVVSADENAHGNAFDRVSAFQDGYTDGAGRCAAMTLDNRVFTQRQFGSAADRARARRPAAAAAARCRAGGRPHLVGGGRRNARSGLAGTPVADGAVRRMRRGGPGGPGTGPVLRGGRQRLGRA